MLMNDALHAGKKVALALHRLIETKYPAGHASPGRLSLQRQADSRPKICPSIVSLTYFMEHGTDIKEALRFARQLLGSQRDAPIGRSF